MAHVGGELIVFAGITVYFHKKTSALQAQIDALEQENKNLVEGLENVSMRLEQLGSYVMANSDGKQIATRGKPAQNRPVRRRRPAPASTQALGSEPGRTNISAPASEDTDCETLDERELDEELQDEYRQLDNNTSEKKIEVVEECDGDTCPI